MSKRESDVGIFKPSKRDRAALERATKVFDRFFERKEGEDAEADSAFVSDLVGRAEGPNWDPAQLSIICEAQATIAHAVRFEGIFGNGGLQYWIECDDRRYYARKSVAAFRRLQLTTIASALDELYDAFPLSEAYDDFDWRIQRLEDLSEELERLDTACWKAHGDIDAALVAFVRAHRSEFEPLRELRSWCSILEEYEDYSDD